jgi:hypothetical protein
MIIPVAMARTVNCGSDVLGGGKVFVDESEAMKPFRVRRQASSMALVQCGRRVDSWRFKSKKGAVYRVFPHQSNRGICYMIHMF